ncbi:tRNA (adenosine(37)-N6)-threonylcarbamoyltransferase complex dimerization subunit type 1 TsaB [Arsenophonus symbiont of Ornithomya chloropus]|uniref:tRNA (adenosine(37)-N6)-threonylcarbamoyltransferase complex dimerization subunit type 1 TsaB n=1 Tax=Arsenophonus symbiont of Ornithomya chloropus TaxID=634121 RepID=UPI0032B264F6
MTINILAIDSATEACSVALIYNKKIFAKFVISPEEHTKKILFMLNQCLLEADFNLKKLDFLAFGQGPGSFTGVRIGVGIAQGLAFACNLPMIGISSLLTIAQGAYNQLGRKKILVAINAGMGEIYAACYQLNVNGIWEGEETEAILKPNQFLSKIDGLHGKWTISGNSWFTYPILKMAKVNLVESSIYLPDARYMLPLAFKNWKRGKKIHPEKAKPIYLRSKFHWKKNI